MVRFLAVLLGLLLVVADPAAGVAEGRTGAWREADMAGAMRGILARTRAPAEVAEQLQTYGARFVGFQETKVTFAYDGERVIQTPGDSPFTPMAGEKADLTLTLWLYEWQNRDGSFTEQAAISGLWKATEYSWLDDPADVIDVRWTVGDLVYLSSTPFDGVKRDQHTNGIASFTVKDQVKAWDLFVTFKPVSSSVHGRWTNVFANYTHTWFGFKLQVALAAAPNGSTGTITINTDAQTWTEGTGLALQIGSKATRGPAKTGFRPDRFPPNRLGTL